MAFEHEAHNDFSQLQMNRDLMTVLSQLANESQELSDQMMQTNVDNLRKVIELSWELTEDYLQGEEMNKQPDQTQAQIDRRKDYYAKRQTEFEKVVENVCYVLLFQVHEQLDNLQFDENFNQNESNVQKSIMKTPDLVDVLKKVITSPTITSAAVNFLVIFADLITVVMLVRGREKFKEYINWLGDLVERQLLSLKMILGVTTFNKFNPADIKKVKTVRAPALVEQD